MQKQAFLLFKRPTALTLARRRLMMGVMVVASLAAPSASRADMIELGTDLNLTWDMALQPGGSSALVIPIDNGAPSGNPVLGGWILDLAVVPISATGSLSINASTASFPAAGYPNVLTMDPYFFNPSPASGLASSVLVSAADQPAGSSDKVPMSGTYLAQIAFGTTNPNTSGTFELEAIGNNSNGNGNTAWYDAEGNGYAFSGGTTIDLGTITVSPAAVPEPGSMLLAAIATAGCAGYGWRRRRNANSAAPVTPATDTPAG